MNQFQAPQQDVIRCKATGLGQSIEWAVESPREMTAEDLGLTASDFGIRSTRRSRPTTEWFKGDLGLPRTIYAYGQYWHVVEPPDVPYAFWLGADA